MAIVEIVKNADKCIGKWVATKSLFEKKVICSGDSLDIVWDEAQKKASHRQWSYSYRTNPSYWADSENGKGTHSPLLS